MSYNRRGGGPDYRKAYYAQQHGYEAAEAKFGPDSNDQRDNQPTPNRSSNNAPRGGGRDRVYGANNAAFGGSQNNSSQYSHQGGQQSGRGGYSRGRGGNSGGGCFTCGQTGHLSRDCPQAASQRPPQNNNDRPNNGACFRCGQTGHISRDCTQQSAARGGGGRGRGRQDFQEGGSVNSDTRTNYDRIVRQFIDNEELTEMAFPSTLTAGERHAVHELAMHYNLEHVSSGPKEARILLISKKGGKVRGGNGVDSNGEVVESSKLTSDGIVKTIDGYQGLQALDDDRFPSAAAQVAKLIAQPHARMMAQLQKVVTEGSSSHVKSKRFAEESGFSGPRPRATEADISGKAALASFRKGLPSYKVKDKIVESVQNNRVTIIAGDTGCGKTTQIPQILYDANIFPREKAIVCTQPRRISALSVAQRVAKERGEACGDSCGYIIRFENATSSATRIVYVTTGILLRRMNSDPTLNGVSCVVLDEVHERDLFTDFALLMLRDLLLSGKAPHLRVVVMSATIQIDKLQKYFSFEQKPVPPIVSIPGTLFKVAEYYLEDALRWLRMPKEAATAMNLIEERRNEKEATNDNDEATASSAASSPNVVSDYEKMKSVALTQLSKDDEMTVPFEVISNLIEMFHTQSKDLGEAVLVFLPGWQQISRIGDMLRRSKYSKELSVFMLHSSISAAQQARVFYPAPKGYRKIVLATNIAETSITIDDVVYVIDSCILKGTAYDAAGNTVSLKSQTIAKANGIQRRGRAGRVRAGVCVHLLPKSVYSELPDFLPPEILRAPLDEVCLQIKALNEVDTVVEVLARAMDTPSFASIAHAVKMLKDMAAFDHREKLTNLGRALAALPLHPQLGKMLLVAAVIGVLEPVAIIASSLAAKSPFIRPMPFEFDAFDRLRTSLDRGDASDHLTTLRLYQGWLASGCSPAYARSNFADEVVLRGMRRSVQQLTRLVYQCGFLRHVLPSELRAPRKGAAGNDSLMDLSLRYASRHQHNNGLIRMALLWSFYPRIGCSETHKTRSKRELFCWDNKPCAAHTSSILFKKKKDFFIGREFFMYFERMRIEVNLNVMDATLVTPLMALLAAQIVTVHPLKDVPEACYYDKVSTFGPFNAKGTQPEAMNLTSTTVLQMDKGKKLFCVSNDQAIVIRDLREVMEFYFSLAVKSVDASLFPHEVVTALGEAIGFPVEAVDLTALQQAGEGMLQTINNGDEEDDVAPEVKQFSWNRGDLESSDSDDEGPEFVDENFIEQQTATIFDKMTEEERNRIYDVFGDIPVLRRRDKDFKIVAVEGDEAVHNDAPSPLSDETGNDDTPVANTLPAQSTVEEQDGGAVWD